MVRLYDIWILERNVNNHLTKFRIERMTQKYYDVQTFNNDKRNLSYKCKLCNLYSVYIMFISFVCIILRVVIYIIIIIHLIFVCAVWQWSAVRNKLWLELVYFGANTRPTHTMTKLIIFFFFFARARLYYTIFLAQGPRTLRFCPAKHILLYT